MKKIVDAVQANPTLWADTAIFITFDEGGGYYDSGYVQPLDFFGDGTRIPLLVVSPYTDGGPHLAHLHRSCVDRRSSSSANWKHRHDHQSQPRQSAEPAARLDPLCTGQPAGHRRPVRSVQFPSLRYWQGCPGGVAGRDSPHDIIFIDA